MLDNKIEYEDLMGVISFKGYVFGLWYKHEEEILRPRLEAKGYSQIVFEMGKSDSFGPLTRICRCVDSEGDRQYFIYG
jgi:hypothetical protein